MRAIIVDDELRARRVLTNLIGLESSEIEIVGECDSVMAAVQMIAETQPDLVFLDIQMPKYNGYELFNLIDKVDFEVIFVTAYEQYAIKAFELNALDYLTKPIERSRLKLAIEKVAKHYQNKKSFQEYQELVKALESKELKTITISELNARKVLKIEDIIAIEAMGAYSKIYLRNHMEEMVSKGLKHFDDMLESDARFYRVHKSWIVAIDKIISYNTTNFTIICADDLVIKLSKSKKDELARLLN